MYLSEISNKCTAKLGSMPWKKGHMSQWLRAAGLELDTYENKPVVRFGHGHTTLSSSLTDTVLVSGPSQEPARVLTTSNESASSASLEAAQESSSLTSTTCKREQSATRLPFPMGLPRDFLVTYVQLIKQEFRDHLSKSSMIRRLL